VTLPANDRGVGFPPFTDLKEGILFVIRAMLRQESEDRVFNVDLHLGVCSRAPGIRILILGIISAFSNLGKVIYRLCPII